MQPTLTAVALAMPDILAPVWVEMCMFGLAMACYAAFTGATPGGQPSKGKVLGRRTASPAPGPEAGVQQLWAALRQGRCAAALEQFQQLPRASASQCSARLLGALAQAPLGDGVVERLMDLAGCFDGGALEAAASQAQRKSDLEGCQRLFRIAGLASIPKSQRALEFLVRGHSADPGAMRALVEEIAAEGCGFSSSLFALCDAQGPVGEGNRGRTAERFRRVGRSPQVHVEAICAFGKEGHLDKAIGVLESLRQAGSPLGALVYNCLLDACVHCEDMPAALTYFTEMKNAGLADVVSFNTVMKGHLARGDIVAAQGLLEEISALGVAATCVTYHGLLNAHAQQGNRRAMWQVVGQMQAAGLRANAVTCSILFKAVLSPAQAADLQRIIRLVDEVEQPSDDVLFASLVEACLRAKSLGPLSERLRAFAAQGKLAKLSSPTYGSMIKAYGQVRDVVRVWELWRQMAAQQVTPTAITVGCMVEALVMNGCSQEAWELAQTLWEDADQRASVNTVIYSTILKGFAMARQHEKVTALYEEMKQRGIARNLITYNTILNSLARCGLMHRAAELLEEMRSAEPRADPDLVSYSTIIKGYCQSGDVDKGLELLRQMRSEASLKPDEVTYNSLLDGCAREQRLEEALRLLAEMRDAHIAPSNYTLSILCKLLGRARRLDQAFELVESISREHGFQPNIQVYTCLIQACFHNRQVGKALALHDHIVRERVVPDAKTYEVLASGCLRAGAVEKAAMVVRCAHHLPCGLRLTEKPQGMDPKCLKDVMAQLRRGNPVAAKALDAELQACARPHGRPAAPRAAAQQRMSGRRSAE